MQIGRPEEIVERTVYCDPATGNEISEPKVLPEGAKGPDRITFGLRRVLTGRDDIAISNALFRSVGSGRKTETKFCPGEARRARVCRSVVWIKGDLTDAAGQPVTAMTDAAYDDLPSWLVAKVYSWLQEIDDEGAIDEGESSGQ